MKFHASERFRRLKNKKNHASERFRRLKKWNFILLNVSERLKIRISCFWTFQKAQKMKIHASEHFRRFGNMNLIISSGWLSFNEYQRNVLCHMIIGLYLLGWKVLFSIFWNLLYSRPLKTISQHKACTDKLYADSFYKVQKNSHSSFEVICCRS